MYENYFCAILIKSESFVIFPFKKNGITLIEIYIGYGIPLKYGYSFRS